MQASTAKEIDELWSPVYSSSTPVTILVSGDAFLLNQSDQIAKLAMRYVLPTCFAFREFAAAGGLMSYGADKKRHLASSRQLCCSHP